MFADLNELGQELMPLIDYVDYESERWLLWRHFSRQEVIDSEPMENRIDSPKRIAEPEIYPNMTVDQVRAVQGLKMLRDMDLEADPCEDFYQYTCKLYDVTLCNLNT